MPILGRFVPTLALALAAGLALAAATAPSAHAAPTGVSIQDATPAQKKEAQGNYEVGAKLFEQKKFSEALVAFEASYGLVRSPNAHLMLARALVELDRAPRAYRELLIAEEEAKSNEKYATTLEKIRFHLSELKPKVALVRVGVQGVSGAYVARVGDEELPIGEERAFAPGPISVSVLEGGAVKATKQAVLVAGQQSTIELSIEVAPPPVVPPPWVPPPVTRKTDDSFTYIVAGAVVGGVGLIGLGVGTGLYVAAKSDYDALVDACGTSATACPAGSREQIDAGQEKQAGAIIAWVAGGVTTGVGVGILIAGITKSGAKNDDAVRVNVGPSSVSLTSRF